MRALSNWPIACLLLIAGMLAAPVRAQQLPTGFDETYSLSALDPVIVSDASAVVRLHLERFKVANEGKATRTVRRAVTILNQAARAEGELVVFYDDRLLRLKSLEGRVWDASGRVVRKLKRDDIDDYSAISDASLYEDNRVRVARLYHDAYPYTVEYEYEVVHDGLLNWPVWYPQERGLPVVFGRFEVDAPGDVEVRYAVENGPLPSTTAERGGRQVIGWQVESLPPLEVEPNGPSWTMQALAVHTAPASFEIEGSRGRLDSWEAFGAWYAALSEGRDELPPEAKAEVRRLTEGITDDREKARRLYEYLQQKTRYVSIQLGLGGWQPFDAAYVHERGYGDCKALTNYMKALLKEAGVPALPALIQAGGRAPEILDGFPSNQFNHVILYVPPPAGPLWLECTSQTIPFGHLGAFTEDRYALVASSEGSELMRTPRSSADQNQQVRHATVQLTPSGDASASIRVRYTGNYQDGVRQALARQSARDRKAWLAEHFVLAGAEIRKADFSEVDAKTLAVTLPVEVALPRYASRTGARLFVPLAFKDQRAISLPPAGSRTQPIVLFPYAFTEADTLEIAIPEGFQAEALPEPVDVQADFGRYQAKAVLQDDGMLVYTRRFEITNPKLAADQYEALRAFLSHVLVADKAQAVFVFKT